MDDPVGSVRQVLRLALIIKTAADTVRHNKAACVELRSAVDIVHAIVAPLENIDTPLAPGMSAALTCLEEALRRGHNLVTACQKKRNIIYILFTAARRSKQLLKVKEDIHARVHFASFAVTVFLVTVTHDRHSQRYLHPPLPEGAGVMDNSTMSGQSYSVNHVSMHIVEGNDGASPRLRIFNPSVLETATSNFLEENVIGKAGRGTVFKGELLDELLVAIKRYPDHSGLQSIQQYVHVFHLLAEHENIVKFLGFCHVDGSEMVVQEYMPNGSLFEIINGMSSQKLDWPFIFGVIRGVTQGVAYLHSKQIIHLDLNPANVVFDSNMTPKITNFERSKLLDKTVSEAVSSQLVGTMGYMSPEYITDGIISMANDLFGLGVLVLHSISLMSTSKLDRHPITWAWQVREAQEYSWCNDHQLEEINRCMEIGLLCTQEFRKDRPTMPDVLEFLNGNEMLPTPKKPRFI